MSLGDAEKMLKEHEDLKVGCNFFSGGANVGHSLVYIALPK